MTSRRPEVVAYATMLADLGANPADPVNRAAYLQLIAPGETPDRADELATMSGCGLVCRGVLGEFVAHPLLEPPYHTGKVLEQLVTIAREAGALHGPERIPEPGDLVLVGGGRDGGGPEHVWVALTVEPDPHDEHSLAVEGLDGGQRDAAGHQVVKLRKHVLGAGYDKASDDGAPGSTTRKVRHVIDLEAVIDAFGR